MGELLRVGGWADVRFEGLAPRFEFVGDCHVVAKEAVFGHGATHYTRQDCTRMKSYPHLQTNQSTFQMSVYVD